jgi:glycosyltransferase involved in cell wall biosynthesis
MRDFIPDENLRKLYSNAICTVLVSTLEGFGLTIPEAMACACPVIVSNQMPHMELVGNNQVAVDPLNIDSVYNGILRIIEDTNLRNLNKQKALERAKLFNWDKCVDDIKKLL